VLLINVLSRRLGEEHIEPFVRTLQAVFPSVYASSFGNYLLIATRARTDLATIKAHLERPVADPNLDHVLARIRPTLRQAQARPGVRPFTDDRNDVEMRSFELLNGPN